MARQRNIGMIVLSRLVGICAFLVLLLLANWLAATWGNTGMLATVVFLNASLGIILLVSLILLIGDVMGALAFPLNLAAPPFNAAGAVLLVWFLLRMLSLVDVVSGVAVSSRVAWLEPLVYPIVFLAVLAFGYASIFLCRSFGAAEDRWCFERRDYGGRIERRERRAREWGEVGDEFRGMLLDGFKRAREELRAKPSEPKMGASPGRPGKKEKRGMGGRKRRSSSRAR